MNSRFKLALIQLAVGKNKLDNVTNACLKIAEASKAGAKIISLPECFNSPYGNTYFSEYAEPIPGETTSALSKAAKDNQIYLVGGSIPESDGGKLYNTCTIYNPNGDLISKYRKSHLFDIDIPGKITFQESKTLTKGNKLITFDTPYCRVGIGICFDIRFPQMAKAYADAGCHVLLYPGAFNMTTGPAHWELLTRARAVDNLSYVACCSPARDDTASYKAWGHSLVVNPWGDVITQADEKEQIIYAEVDLHKVKEIRGQIPVFDASQPGLYTSPIENVPC